MATRKRLRPVATPVDAFVTPANPGPEQSNQSWDGLMQLSQSLMSADAAYRQAEKRKEQEARTKKTEERTQRAEADRYAPVAFEVLDKLPKKELELYKSGEADEDLRLKIAGLLEEAGVPDASNPQLLQSIARFEVARLPDDTGYARMMEDPEFLDTIVNLPEDQKLDAYNQRKQAYIAELLEEGRLNQSQVPILLSALRPLDDERNAAMAARRDRQHEAKTTAILADAAGRVAKAITLGEEDEQIQAIENAQQVMKTLSATKKGVAQSKLLAALKDRVVNEIDSEEMSEEDALEILTAVEDAGLLDAEQQADLERVVDAKLAARAESPVKSAQVDKDAISFLTKEIITLEETNGSRLTEEQLKTLMKGKLPEVQAIYEKAGLSMNRAYTAVLEAKRLARADREAPRPDDREVVISLETNIRNLSPDAIDLVDQAYKDRKIGSETRNRLMGDIESSTDPAQADARVARFLSQQKIPAGIAEADIMPELVRTFTSTTGTVKERSQAMRDAYTVAVNARINAQADSQRVDKTAFWMAEGRSGRSGAIRSNINDVAASLQTDYDEEEADQLYSDVLDYIFDGMDDKERHKFRRMNEAEAALHLTSRVQQLREPVQRQALEARLKENRDRKEEAALRKMLTGKTAEETEGVAYSGPGKQNIRDATRKSMASLADPGGMFHTLIFGRDAYVDAAHQFVTRVAEVQPGGDLSERLPTVWEIRGNDSSYIRALALVQGVTDGVRMPEFSEFPGIDSANDYLRAHTLNYGVPLESLAKGKHLGVDLQDMKLTWDSSPYFTSREDLLSQVFQDAEGTWQLGDTAQKAFGFLKLNTEQETIQRFYNAQLKMTSEDVNEQKFLKRMQTPDLSTMRREDGLIKFRNNNLLESEFRRKVLGDK